MELARFVIRGELGKSAGLDVLEYQRLATISHICCTLCLTVYDSVLYALATSIGEPVTDPTVQVTQGHARTVRIRPATDLKLTAITTKRRWTDTEAIDAMCDEFMLRHAISVPKAEAKSA